MADEDDNEQAASGGNKKLIIIAALVSVLLGGGGAAAVLTLTGGDKSEDVAEAEATEEEVDEEPVQPTYVELSPEFVINFRDRNNRAKFLKADMSVATTEEGLEEQITLHMPAIRNNLVLLLSRQVYEDLVPHEGKENLRKLALAEVQSVLEERIGTPGVDDLFFSNFVMH